MSWGWKLANSTDDAIDFLNGSGAYSRSVNDARICAIKQSNRVDFYIFYRQTNSDIRWGWKKATDPDDACNFLSGAGAYSHPVKEAQISAVWQGHYLEFYIFYQRTAPGDMVPSAWGWKLSSDPDDAMDFLNGKNGYQHPVTTARISALQKDSHDEFYIFYQQAIDAEPVNNWGWKLANSTDDTYNFVNGRGAYQTPVRGFELAAIKKESAIHYHAFVNLGTQIWLQSPLKNERFVQGESICLKAFVTSEQPIDGNEIAWTSDRDGSLGQGSSVTVSNLSPGAHTITATGYDVQSQKPLRVYKDLGSFYRARPAWSEIERIDKDFALKWVDGEKEDEKWEAYPKVFDQTSTDPSKLVIYAKLDVLRHQRFAEPLPFSSDSSFYDNLKRHTKALNLYLNCRYNASGSGAISLNRSLSVWDGRVSGTPDDPDACKEPFANPSLYPYVSPLYLLIHEGRHNEPGDPRHITVEGVQMDPTFQDGSGHARAAMYLMWVYKYSLYDPPEIKERAREIATSLLQGRFPDTPNHSNPMVQAIIDELLEE